VVKYSLTMNFFQNMISSIMENGLSLSRFRAQGFGTLHKDINQATESVMHTSGEVSSIAFADILNTYLVNTMLTQKLLLKLLKNIQQTKIKKIFRSLVMLLNQNG
jgi:hypothetical protein